MKTILLACALAMTPGALRAMPIAFFDSSYHTATLAIAGTDSATDGANTPASSLPLTTSSNASDGDSLADAAAFADDGTLGTLVQTLGGEGSPAALASSEFIGRFVVPQGFVELFLDFASDTSVDGGGSADAVLRVTLVTGSETWLDQTFNATGQFRSTFGLPAGATGELALLLVSSASGSALEDVSSAGGGVAFSARQVPEPSTLALVLLLAVAGVARQRSVAKR